MPAVTQISAILHMFFKNSANNLFDDYFCNFYSEISHTTPLFDAKVAE